MAEESPTSSQGRPGKRCKVAGYGFHGKIPKEFADGENNIAKMIFHIHDFANLQKKRGECINTTNVKAHGHLWYLFFFPGGDNKSNADVEHLTLGLVYDGKNTETDPVVAKAVVRTKTDYEKTPRNEFSQGDKNGFGWSDFATREYIIENDCDEAGTLTITVELQVATEKRSVWFPKLNYCDTIIGTQLYRSMKSSDVSFIVGESKTELRGHTFMIEMRSPSLYDLIETEKESSSKNEDDRSETQLVLPDIDVMDFMIVLEFMYTDKVPTIWKKEGGGIEKAKSILRVADRLGCTDLKLYMESTLVETFLVPSTAADLLLLADSHNCALLKEQTMEMYMIDSTSFMESNPNNDCWKKLQESPKLLTELLLYTSAAGARRRTRYSSFVDGNNGTPEDADGFDVTSLRERLQKMDLDVDGSREILVDRWKNHLLRAAKDDDTEEAAEDDDAEAEDDEAAADDDDNDVEIVRRVVDAE